MLRNKSSVLFLKTRETIKKADVARVMTVTTKSA
jgi:hypothetical protein